MSKTCEAVTRLQEIIASLVAPEGCEWDRAQTPVSLCEYVLEEAYELVEAIRQGTVADVQEELGDVFFLLFFLSHLYAQGEPAFSLEQTLEAATAKMVRRHPHVFAGTVFANLEEQLAAWETIKREEKNAESAEPKGVFSSLPSGLPPLSKAYRINSKAARVGFTWDNDDDVMEQFESELLEFLDAVEFGDDDAKMHEFGDLLFILVEIGRRKGIKANAALDAANTRFLRRFALMEKQANSRGKEFSGLTMEEKNLLWDEAKLSLATGV